MSLADLLNRVAVTVRRFVVVNREAADAIALWIAATHCVDVAGFAPILAVHSPMPRCGKTTLVDVVGGLVRSPLGASNASAAALFRVVDKVHPTLLLDEVDTVFSQKTEQAEALRMVLNAGHRRGQSSFVLRAEARGADFETRSFDCFAFKLLAGIGKLPPTVRDRSITITLRRKLADESADRLRIARVEPELHALRDELAAYLAENAERIVLFDPALPDSLGDRAQDNWELLFQLAFDAGGDWPSRARFAALALSAETDDGDADHGVQLLGDLRDYFDAEGRTTATSADLVEYLNGLDERGWATWSGNKGITTHALARELRRFGVRPARISLSNTKIRGYRLPDLVEPFQRYLSNPDSTVQVAPPDGNSLPDNKIHGTTSVDGSTCKVELGVVPPAESEPVPSGSTCKVELSEQVEPGNSFTVKDIGADGATWTVESGEPEPFDESPGGLDLF